MRKQILRIVVLIFILLCPDASGLYAQGTESLNRASIKSDSVAVYSGMFDSGKILKFLKKGDKVTVEIEIEGAEGTWCGIIEQGHTEITGYVECKYLEREELQKKIWQDVGSFVDRKMRRATDMNETNIIIEGNSVLIPVTLGYKDRTVEALLLLDTGATISVINAETADQLGITPTETKVESGQVVGGGLIILFITKVDYITAGPHTKNKMRIGVVVHEGPPVRFDGLLGMDFLRGLKYYIDFKNQIIKWEPQ